MATFSIRHRTGQTYEVLVDDADLEYVLSQGGWRPCPSTDTVYVGRRHRKDRPTLLHRLLLPSEQNVDHINGNGLDNRRCNLREVSVSQNLANSKKSRANKSGYKGVCWHKGHNKWRAYIVQNYKQVHLGLFDTAEQAHTAYVTASQRLFGEFANPTGVHVGREGACTWGSPGRIERGKAK